MSAQPDLRVVEQSVMEALRAERFSDALLGTASLIAARPNDAVARHYAALALHGLKEPAAAEREMRQAIECDPKDPAHHVGLADMLAFQGRTMEAEGAYRAALAINPRHDAAIGLTGLLMRQGRAAEALPFIEPLARSPAADVYALAAGAAALNAVERKPEAEEMYIRALQLDPDNAALEHNLAAVLEEMRRYPEAEAAARRAMAKGSDYSSLVLARSLQGQDKHDEAELAYRAAVKWKLSDASVHKEHAGLVWQRTGSREAMLAGLEFAIEALPDQLPLRITRASLLNESGVPRAAYASLQADLTDDAPALVHASAAQAALTWDATLALEHARKASQQAPFNNNFSVILIEALLANGEALEAEGVAEQVLRDEPDNQYVIALRALAWRMLGDDRYAKLYDYDSLVGVYEIETPVGWDSLEAYLADLAVAVGKLHHLSNHPLDQSLRGGSQTQRDLVREQDPAIRAFFQAINGPIAAYRAGLGVGDDPIRRRNDEGDCYLAGAWSARLAPGGFHANHVHRQGWISSAFYIQLPKAVEDEEGKQGWLQFGQPQRPTEPALEAERFVQPKPGRLVLFPSYMWHGTVPFEGDEHRLTIAFDVIPTPRGG